MSDELKSLDNDEATDNTTNPEAADNITSSTTEEISDTTQEQVQPDITQQSQPDINDSDSEPKSKDDNALDDTSPSVDIKVDANTDKKKKFYKLLQLVCIVGFVIFAALFINEVVIQPIRIKNSIDMTRDLYKKPTPAPRPTKGPAAPTPEVTQAPVPTDTPPTPTPDPNRDAQGRLLQFADLLAINDDVKGWLTIPDTNIDYVVVQSDRDNPELYLDKDINLEYSKAGTLFLDISCSVDYNTQSFVIHGHNMVSTAEKMFHDLLKYKVNKTSKNKVPSYYKKHPVITFDNIYETGQWKIFAVFITNGSDKKEPFFDYTKARFHDTSDFLNFVYQLRIRSELNINSVDITDTDQLLVLSTCSYEVDDYRTVIVARRVRDGEDPTVDTDAVTVNKTPLYPKSYYYRYGGKAPKLAETFEEALANGDISWYTPPEMINYRDNLEINELDTNEEVSELEQSDKDLIVEEASDSQLSQEEASVNEANESAQETLAQEVNEADQGEE